MNYYEKIKDLLINNEVYKKVKDYSKNRSDLNTYYEVGRLIVEAQGGEARAKYGNELIKEYSKKLTKDLGKKMSITSLKYMRQFYLYLKGQPVADQLTWSHYIEILPIKDENKKNYYIELVNKTSISTKKLRKRIKSKEYERLPEETKEKLKRKEEKYELVDFIKNPIVINNPNKIDISNIKEKYLKELILEDISSFMKELGEGFSFIDSEYKIIIGNNPNYIDLLLFNYIYNSFVVVELKVTELKKEHIGQIEVYMNYIDKHIKSINQDNTIGLIICKKDNKFILGYSSDTRIFFIFNC